MSTIEIIVLVLVALFFSINLPGAPRFYGAILRRILPPKREP